MFLAYMKRRKIEGERFIEKLKINNESLARSNIELMNELRTNQNKITELSNELLFKQVTLKNDFVRRFRSEIESLHKKHRLEIERLSKRQEMESLKLFNVQRLDQELVFCDKNMSVASVRNSIDRMSIDDPNQANVEAQSDRDRVTPEQNENNQPKRYYLSEDEKENHRRNSLNVHIGNYVKNVGPPLTPLLEISSSQISSQKSNSTLVRSDHDNIVDTTIGDMSLTMFDKSPHLPSSQEQRLPHDATTSTPSILKFDQPIPDEADLIPAGDDDHLSRPSFLDDDYEYESPRCPSSVVVDNMLPRNSYFCRPSFLQSIEFNLPTENICHLDPRLPSELPSFTSTAYVHSPTISSKKIP